MKEKVQFTSALNEVDITVDANILEEVSRASDGFPALIHIFGENMYDTDTDSHIDMVDYDNGLTNVVKHIKKTELNDKLKGA